MDWTAQQIEFIREHLEKPTKEVYSLYQDCFGSSRSYDSVQKRVKGLREAFEPDENVEEGELKSGLEQLLTPGANLFVPQISPSEKAQNTLRARQWLQGLVQEYKNIQFVEPDIEINGEGTSLCIVISDTHIGQHNKWYNIDESAHRFKNLAKQVYQQIGPLKIIDEVVILLVGDIVEGEDIYPTQANHITCCVVDQVEYAVEFIWDMMIRLRDYFQVPVRAVAVPGNHGRAGKNVDEKTNWDNVVYHSLRLLAKHTESNITIECSYEPFETFYVKGKKGLLYHQGVKHTGTPAMREKIAGWVMTKGTDFTVSGHWHEWKIGNWLGHPVIANGCMCGPNDLSERIAKEDRARQGYFLVTPKRPLWGFGYIEWPEDRGDEIPLDSEEHQ